MKKHKKDGRTKTEYAHVYAGDSKHWANEKYGDYQYFVNINGTNYYGCYPTARAAALALDKKFLSLGIFDRLQILKPYARNKAAA